MMYEFDDLASTPTEILNVEMIVRCARGKEPEFGLGPRGQAAKRRYEQDAKNG